MRQQGGFIPLPLILYAVAALAIIGALAAVYRGIDQRGYERGKAECERAARVQRDAELAASAAASTKLETENAKSRIVYRTITKSVDKIVDRPVYRSVCLDADGLRIAAAALRGPRADPGQPDGAVPGSDAAGGGDRSSGVAEDR